MATKEQKAEYNRKHYQKNKAILNAKHKAYIEQNKESRREYMRVYCATRMANDPLYKLKQNMRTRVANGFAYWNKTKTDKRYKTKKSSTEKLLGCSYSDFKDYIESQFVDGMNFYNIHIDHHIPLCSAKTEEGLISLLHYTNCKPLFAKDNLIKGSKIPVL